MITINLTGHPRPQGSKIRTQWGMREASDIKPWRDAITTAAIESLAGAPPLEGPVSVGIVFGFNRPAGHYGSGRNAGVVKPSAPEGPVTRSVGDVDKLARGVLDALTAAKVFFDDSQVVELRAVKVFIGRGHREGARITVGPATPDLGGPLPVPAVGVAEPLVVVS